MGGDDVLPLATFLWRFLSTISPCRTIRFSHGETTVLYTINPIPHPPITSISVDLARIHWVPGVREEKSFYICDDCFGIFETLRCKRNRKNPKCYSTIKIVLVNAQENLLN